MKKLIVVFVAFLLAPLLSLSQEDELSRPGSSGQFQLGMRTTYSLFGYQGFVGEGVGGQFRLRFGDKLNSEWFADYITTNLDDLGKRVDAHIGWSVMFYPLEYPGGVFNPYILAGHCFDYTKVSPYSTLAEYRGDQSVDRWSSAVQMGLGTHLYISSKVDLSLSAQYMQHLGKDIHYEIENENGVKALHIDNEAETVGFEGHVFITMSLNVNIADLW